MKKTAIALLLSAVLMFTQGCGALGNNNPAQVDIRILGAFIDSKKEIVVELSAFLDASSIKPKDFSVEAGKGKLQIAQVMPLNAKQGNSKLLGYETLMKDTLVQFVYAPMEMGYTPKGNESIYVLGEFNAYQKSDEYKMEYDKLLNIYKLTMDLGVEGSVAFGHRFGFAAYNDNAKVFETGRKFKLDQFAGRTAKQFKLVMDDDLALSDNFVVKYKNFAEGKVVMRKVLETEEFLYSGNDLGASCSKDATVFKVWSPVASAMKVVIYQTYRDNQGKVYDMNKADQGVWELKLDGDFRNQYYNYRVTIDGVERETPDPYAKSATANGAKGMIVDIQSIAPEGWDSHRVPAGLTPTQSIIYEMHVRDFSTAESSGIRNKGKYLAFTEAGTKTKQGVSTGLDHLKELGITHMHLLPVYDYASVDETKSGQYNWGYDPYLYNVPEGSYATDPYDGTVRIKEFKEMVKALHENDIRVVMDVVYNHTYSTGNSPFDILVPGYYYRQDQSGNYTNGSGCGNETASEKAMMRKFIVDSVKFWATEYKIDGFRFDLMALHDIETMKEVERELRKINPSILIYGEPWTGGATALNSALQLKKGSQKGMNIAVFNDEIRNAIKGDNDGNGLGFVNGASGLEQEVKKGIVGSIHYSDSIHGFTEQPSESINYVSSHDNLALFDKFEKSNPGLTAGEREKMNRLALSIVLTSQGVPFIQGGTDILRTKKGNHNSYNAGDEINKIDWDRKLEYSQTFDYIKNLIKLRKSQKVMSLSNAEDIQRSLSFLEAPKNTVAYQLSSSFDSDYRKLVIVHNANKEAVTVGLPEAGEWRIIANETEVNQAGVTSGKAAASGDVQVAPMSTYILYKD